jgi:nucleoside phosphorylase
MGVVAVATVAHAGVGADWAARNLGLEYAGARGLAAARVGVAGEELGSSASVRALQRELIDFDSEAPQGEAFRAIAGRAPGGLSRFIDIPWPKGLEPRSGKRPTGTSLPKSDVLVVTWTVDEGHALSRVLAPGFDSRDDWKPYRKNFKAISAQMRAGCPARQAGRLGTYWTTRIGTRRVTLFKSDSHMSQDGPKLPNASVWRQIIADCDPTWVITTGTGGGIGTDLEVGDVIVSPFATFDCQRQFKRLNGDSYACPSEPPVSRFKKAESLFRTNGKFLPSDNSRPPKIVMSTSPQTGILTTDFFGFDNSANTYGLQGKGDLSEMGDAVLGMVCQQLGSKAPLYSIVRNVSDPEINSAGLTLAQQTKLAADIYKGYGRWSSVCSAIVCWAIIAGL